MTRFVEIPTGLDVDNPLWIFALTFWRMPEVERICLSLQASGWSVTRILCACWQATRRRDFYPAETADVVRWRTQVTEVLRAIRQKLPKERDSVAGLRDHVSAAELQAEQIELALAYRALMATDLPVVTGINVLTLARRNLHCAAPEPKIDEETVIMMYRLAGLLATLPESGDPRP